MRSASAFVTIDRKIFEDEEKAKEHEDYALGVLTFLRMKSELPLSDDQILEVSKWLRKYGLRLEDHNAMFTDIEIEKAVWEINDAASRNCKIKI